MLNLNRLKVLCEVVRHGSFSAAAESLSYTQSAVSQSIARLEAETGTPLLIRDRGGVRPTAAGATLIDHADAIFGQVQAAEDELAAVLGIRGGRLRVASFPSAGATLMPIAVATFRVRHPDVALSLAEGEPEDIAPRLRAGEFDLALLFSFGAGREVPTRERPGGGLTSVLLLEDPMQLALPAEHPLAREKTLSLADLREDDWVQTSERSPCARQVVRSCLAAGFEPHVTFESDDYDTVQGLVAAGVGVALIPRLALTRVHPGIVVRALSPSSPQRTVEAATIAGPGVTPAARTMLKVLAEVADHYTQGHLDHYIEGHPEQSLSPPELAAAWSN
jgi:DNA-binding transcriptional LysR family regulator